jgi:hypothetical protein
MWFAIAPREVTKEMARSMNGGIAGVAGVCAVIVALAAIDSRVREHLTGLLAGRASSGELMTMTARVQDFGYTILQAVRDQSIEHAALTIFAMGALVLVLFMMRT